MDIGSLSKGTKARDSLICTLKNSHKNTTLDPSYVPVGVKREEGVCVYAYNIEKYMKEMPLYDIIRQEISKMPLALFSVGQLLWAMQPSLSLFPQ